MKYKLSNVYSVTFQSIFLKPWRVKNYAAAKGYPFFFQFSNCTVRSDIRSEERMVAKLNQHTNVEAFNN